jgi:diguanylate cyclase (GGDEF)-like protein/PAS domain S-box-containing protein
LLAARGERADESATLMNHLFSRLQGVRVARYVAAALMAAVGATLSLAAFGPHLTELRAALFASAWTWQSLLLAALAATAAAVAYTVITARRLEALEASCRIERERAHKAERVAAEQEAKAREIAARFDCALANMSEGFCFFGSDRRLIACNNRYIDMYRIPRDRVKPGIDIGEIIDLRLQYDTSPGQLTKEEYLAQLRNLEEPSDLILNLRDGRVLELHCRPVPGGGWVATHEDVTARYQAEKSLAEAKANAERAEREARIAHATLVDALDVVPEGLVVLDAEDRLVLWNRQYAAIYPESSDLMKPGVTFEQLLRHGLARGQYPDAKGREDEWLRERLAQHAQPRIMLEQRVAGGRWVRIEERRTTNGGCIGLRVDITDLKRREASFRLLFEGNPLPMWVTDLDSLKLLDVNSATCQHYGYTREQLLTMTVDELRVPEDRADLRHRIRDLDGHWTGQGTHRHITADGRIIHVAVEGRRHQYEGYDACIAVAFDMTERKLAEDQIRHLARHDPLTQLANRTVFIESLDHAFAQIRKDGKPFTVLILDLDEFKNVNDSLGHPTGDALLKAVAERLRTCAPSDTIARMGGDEFAILRTVGSDQREDAIVLATQLMQSLTEPYDLDGRKALIGTSIGIALAPDHGDERDQLLKNADLALYSAKAEGRNCYRVFESKMEADAHARQALQADLRGALARNEFELHYQTIRDPAMGKVSGVEALIRWRHPQRGLIAPDQFIPIAEETGLIVPLGEWILRRACTDAAHWPSDIKVAVNLSVRQFESGNLLEFVSNALSVSGLAPERLELEITESILLQKSADNISQLQALKSAGVSIVLDDFATGYSSLGYLTMFEFDKIKIDRSFIKELGQRADCTAVVCAIVSLGKSLDITTTAEGIETADQLALARAAGCREVQGYLFGRPVPAAELAFEPAPAERAQPRAG